ncbi:MAG: hypothetical protein ABF586_08705 [Sporolactobacillus sp.]
MLQAETTPNAAGVALRGDWDDLNQLYDSLSELIGDEGEHERYEAARIQVLGFMYDLRHAFEGSRDVRVEENGMTREIMKYHGIVTPEKNVYFSFNTVWLEMLFVLAVLNDFILLYSKKIDKGAYIGERMLRPKVAYQPAIAYTRHFQAVVLEALKKTVSESAYVRLINAMTHDYMYYGGYAVQFIEKLTIRYLDMDREKRLKNLTRFGNQIVNRSGDYPKMLQQLRQAAMQYQCSIDELHLAESDYPETIDW